MSERKWTKGPWVTEPENYDGDGGVLVRVGGDYPRNCIANAWRQQSAMEVDDEGQANAHLIAAAPDLYEALEMVNLWFEGSDMDLAKVLKPVKAALSKARGETQ